MFEVPEAHPQDQPIPFAQPYRTRQVLSYPPTQLTHAAYQLLRVQEIYVVKEFVNKREAYLEKKEVSTQISCQPATQTIQKPTTWHGRPRGNTHPTITTKQAR